ncbi:MAG: dienelactone hydrolase family protein [Planctomycetaceae bacterium]|nr:dienelactone hydrolase family protein [Planctomycetaceae bacterium]
MAQTTRSDPTAVSIPAAGVRLEANLILPPHALGVVAFAHGSGSSRHSPRNVYVAEQIQQSRVGTLLMDLLTPSEDVEDQRGGALRFDISLLTGRLIAAIDWLGAQVRTRDLPIGLFGASTGAAAALAAAAERPAVRAVVSRGGRPDLAGDFLPKVQAPTLLIVGGNDLTVLELNRHALHLLRSKKKLITIPAATHLFEEPGSLEQVARYAGQWFATYLRP